jgi:hypothetical protein
VREERECESRERENVRVERERACEREYVGEESGYVKEESIEFPKKKY